MQQQKIRTIHVFFEEADQEQPIVEADTDPNQPEPTRYSTLGFCCGLLFSLLCISIPILATFLPQIYPNTYDTTSAQTVILTLAQHPGAGQLPLYSLVPIYQKQQEAVTATGSIHQQATNAAGLITFYNGLLTEQTVPAETTLTGKDGIKVITSKAAVIPPATPTSPPTYGTVSVTAYASIAGSLGNIADLDINGACCGASILAQNLYPFSGGQDARDIPVLTKTDLATGTQQLTSQVTTVVNDQAQQEVNPGYIMLPLNCTTKLTANHQAGDQVESAIVTLTQTCTPLAYFAPDIEALAQQHFKIPQGYHLVSLSALVAQSNVTPTGGTLTVAVIAYLKQNRAVSSTYHFAGK